MDLGIIRQLENNSGLSSGYEFFTRYKNISVPYLTFIALLTIAGTLGNFLVIETLLIVKVSKWNNVRFVFTIYKKNILNKFSKSAKSSPAQQIEHTQQMQPIDLNGAEDTVLSAKKFTNAEDLPHTASTANQPI